MDGKRFDHFTKTVAGSSRRSFLKTALGVAIGGALGASQRSDASAAIKRGIGNTCSRHADCASGFCGEKDRTGRRRCACSPEFATCKDNCLDPATAFTSDVANCGACGKSCPRTRCEIAICKGGICGLAPDPNAVGRSCDDGNACTTNDICQPDGTCVGTLITCAASDQCHVAGTCDPATGKCTNPDKPNGTACNDGNACTNTDTCQNGLCTGGNPVVCTASDQCHDTGTCNPSTGQCTYPNKTNGSSCNDGNPCTQNDMCQDGTCVGTAVICPAPTVCQVSVACNPSTGQCVATNKADDTVCGAETACSQNLCRSGQCVTVHKSAGTACDDGNACTQTDTCDGNGTCVGGNRKFCPAPDQCHTEGTCDPTTGTCSNPAQANNAPCFDGNACTTGDTCQNGTCTPGTAVICTPVNDCHFAGSCDSGSGFCSEPEKPDGTTCNGGTCCNGNCCPPGKYCCNDGDNHGCCDQPCCGSICCTFSGAKCCNGNVCLVGAHLTCD